jgi:hypothetical protein
MFVGIMVRFGGAGAAPGAILGSEVGQLVDLLLGRSGKGRPLPKGIFKHIQTLYSDSDDVDDDEYSDISDIDDPDDDYPDDDHPDDDDSDDDDYGDYYCYD